jgi:hypothetical protein
MELTTRPMADLAAADSAPSIAELAALHGDLEKLSSEQRMLYYGEVCKSMGLNPLTRPFTFIRLNGKLTLYASKDAGDQLRRVNRVSIAIVSREKVDGVYIVTARATTSDGRSDESTGAVPIEGLKGEALANALMKAETKAKRRVTLSICGLGWLDDSEISSIPDARPVEVNYETGEIVQPARSAVHKQQTADRADRLRQALQELMLVAAKVGIEFDEYDIDVMDTQQLTDLGKAVRANLVARIEDMAEDAIDYDLPEGWQQFKAAQLDALVTDLIAAIAHANEIVEGEIVQGEAL